MTARSRKALSALAAAMLLASLAWPGLAYALGPEQITVTISSTQTTADLVNAPAGGAYTGSDGALITPNTDPGGNGYTYESTNQTSDDVSLQGAGEDLSIVRTAPEASDAPNTIPNSAVTGADPSYDASAINANDVYLGAYTGAGGAYATDNGAFYDGQGNPLNASLPASAATNSSMVNAILAANGVQADPETDYLVVAGDTTIEGNKTVKEVSVTDGDGNVLAGYEVTLEAEGRRTDQIFDSEGNISISGKTNVVLTVDITGSMDDNLGTGTPSRWTVLKQAATEFIDILFGVERDGDGNITNPLDLNPNVGLSLVVYAGGKNNTVARTVTLTAGGNVFTGDDVNELLAYFTSSTARSALTGSTDMLHNAGTNAQAGYMETTSLVDALVSAGGGITGDNIHVVFMTDGEANTYYATADHTSSIAYSSNPTQIADAGKRASEAAVALLEKGVSLHNIVINQSSTANNSIATYMDPKKAGGYLNGLIETGDPDGAVNYDLFNVNYTWANTPEQIIETYRTIASQIVSDALVATQARVIDVIPKGFDIYFVNGNTELKVVGKDDAGNTIIEWYIGDLENGAAHSTRYYLLPNADLGGQYTYGTAYTNDSAILYAKPVVKGGQEVAIVLDRPAIVIDPLAASDSVLESYTNSFSFSLTNGAHSGASGGSAYNLNIDSYGAHKKQAVDTTVSDTYVSSVTNAMIAGVPVAAAPDGYGNWVIESAQLRVTVHADGSVTYEQLGPWPASWGNTADVTFDYSVNFSVYTDIRQLVGAPDAASAGASITLNKPSSPPPAGDPGIPLSPGTSVGTAQLLPLGPGLPATGGAQSLAAGLTLIGLSGVLALLLRRRSRG